MIDIDKTIEGDAVLSVIKYCVLSKINYHKAYKITSGCLKFIALGHNIEVRFLTDRVDRRKLPYIFTNIVGFLENDKSEKTVYDILKKIQPICGLITVDGEIVEMKEENKNNTELSIETLKQMGYKHPCTVRWIIEAVEQGKDLKDIKSGFIESRIASKQNGHILFFFSLSELSRYNDEMEICMMNRRDFVFFIDRVWVPSNNGKLLRKVLKAICDGKTVEEALECLKEEKTSQPATGFTVERLKEMGFHYPELALKVIDFIDHCTSVYGVKDLKVESPKTGEYSCVNSYKVETTEVYRWKVLRVYLTAPDFPFSFAETGKETKEHKADCLCFLNFELIPTANEDDQSNVIWDADVNNIPLEKALEIHLKKATPKEPHTIRRAAKYCMDIFAKKSSLYGDSTREMSLQTMTDQLHMKAVSINTKISAFDVCAQRSDNFESIAGEFAAVVNYGLIALHKMDKEKEAKGDPRSVSDSYYKNLNKAADLIKEKEKTYGGIWKDMRLKTFGEMILTKVLRLKNIEDLHKYGFVDAKSMRESAYDQYFDIVNYGLFGVARFSDLTGAAKEEEAKATQRIEAWETL